MAPADNPANPATDAPPRIVVIDDDGATLKIVAMVLGDPYEVETYDQPKRALEALDDGEAPDLILCDISMPGLDGFALHETIRENPVLRATPFIYMTALDAREHVRRGMGLGADDYLTKPFTPSELRATVASRLGRTGVLRNAAGRDLAATSLGGLGLTAGGRRLQWEAKKAVELLLYLLDRGRRADLDAVRRDLWHRSTSDNHVHVLVSRLRKTLDDVATLETVDHELVLRHDGEVRWDAAAFEAAAAKALANPNGPAIEGAIRLYGGPFLPGFESPWSDTTRTRLESSYIDLLEAAIDVAANDVVRERAQERFDRFLDLG